MKIVLLFFFIPFICLSNDFDLDNIQKKYPNQNSIILNKKNIFNIKLNNNDSIIIDKSIFKEKLYLTNHYSTHPEDYFFYNSFYKLNSITPYHNQLIKNKYKTTRVKNISTKEYFDNSIFYTDSKLITIKYPSTNRGSTTKYEINVSLTEPYLIGKFFFSDFDVVLASELKCIVDKKITLDYRLFNIDSTKLKYELEETNDSYIHIWYYDETDNIDSNNETFHINYFEPHIELFISHYIDSLKNRKNILSSVNDLHSWYYNITESIRNQNFPLLQTYTENIIADCKTDIEKAKTIYYWIQDNIRYIAISDGYNGYVPQTAQKVFETRYGDCKDMTSLLVKMLNYAGLDAFFTWVGTRSIPYSYNSLHTPSVDNHLIATLKIDDTFYYLDATSNMLSIDLPSSFIQGKEALVSISKDSFLIKKIPIIQAATNKYTDSTFLKIENNNIIGNTTIQLSGYNKQVHTARLTKQPSANYLKYFSDNFRRGSDKFVIDSITNLSYINNRDGKMHIGFAFQVPGYVRNINNKKYINLNLVKHIQAEKIKTENRKYNESVKNTYKHSIYYELEIPTDYTISSLPNDFVFEDKNYSSSIKYKQNDSKITLSYTLTINSLEIEIDNFESWNKMIDDINLSFSQILVLEKK